MTLFSEVENDNLAKTLTQVSLPFILCSSQFGRHLSLVSDSPSIFPWKYEFSKNEIRCISFSLPPIKFWIRLKTAEKWSSRLVGNNRLLALQKLSASSLSRLVPKSTTKMDFSKARTLGRWGHLFSRETVFCWEQCQIASIWFLHLILGQKRKDQNTMQKSDRSYHCSQEKS